MDKRTFIKTGVVGIGGVIALSSFTSRKVVNKILKEHTIPEFKMPELSYTFDALEPHIDAATMKLHYSSHFAAYTEKFNAAVKDAGITGKNAKAILTEVSKYPDAIRNNGGGYFNHKLFWRILSPNGGSPHKELLNGITNEFGSFENFKSEFSKASKTVQGQGWTWLILSGKKLKITTTFNQDSPIMDIAEVKGTPLLLMDVWEHAYYLKYQNRHEDYINAFWNVVDWDFISKKYERLMKG